MFGTYAREYTRRNAQVDKSCEEREVLKPAKRGKIPIKDIKRAVLKVKKQRESTVGVTTYKIQEYNESTSNIKYVLFEDYQKLQEEYLRVTKLLNQIELVAGTEMEKTIEYLLNE